MGTSSREIPALVILVHDRDQSLSRLLKSLNQAHFTQKNIPLIISIDKNTNQQVYAMAQDFQWDYGDKLVIEHQSHLGLKNHVLYAGSLTQKWGSVILLEDDLILAPYFYDYALQALSFYENDNKIAGISLYSYALTESNFFPFHPYDEGYDNYFMQVPCSWGQLFTSKQWQNFENWLKKGEQSKSKYFPTYAEDWGEKSWKKAFLGFMIQEDLYFVYPHKSLTSNFEDRGTNSRTDRLFQVELQNYTKACRFLKFDQALSIYDAHFEIKAESLKRLNTKLAEYDFSVDLYQSKKSNQLKELVLSSQAHEAAELQFGNALFPLLNNIIFNFEGKAISLLKKTDLKANETLDRSLFAAPQKQVQKANLKEKTLEFGIVVPLKSVEQDELIPFLKSIESQIHTSWSVILIIEEALTVQVESLLRQKQISKKVSVIANNGLNPISIYELAVKQLHADIFVQLKPERTLSPNYFNRICTLFEQYHSVKFLRLLNPEEKAVDFRWNSKLIAHRIGNQRKQTNLDGIFISRFLWETVGLEQNDGLEEEFLLRAIEQFPFYLLIEKDLISPLSPGQKRQKTKNKIVLRSKPGIPEGIFIEFLKLLYRSKIPFLRAFFPLFYNLNDVLRYDEQNKSFYFNRY